MLSIVFITLITASCDKATDKVILYSVTSEVSIEDIDSEDNKYMVFLNYIMYEFSKSNDVESVIMYAENEIEIKLNNSLSQNDELAFGALVDELVDNLEVFQNETRVNASIEHSDGVFSFTIDLE